MSRIDSVSRLRDITQCDMYSCWKAYDYADGKEEVAVAYLLAKSIAVATPLFTFDQRVMSFVESARYEIDRFDRNTGE